MGTSLVLTVIMLRTALLQTAFVKGFLPPADTSAGAWVHSLIELPIVVLAGFVCGSLLMLPILVLAAVSRHPFVVALRKNWIAIQTPEKLFARRWIGLPFLAIACLALAIASLARGGWSWQVSSWILSGCIFLWVAIRPHDWDYPT
jgi:hypothetical protein